MKSCSHTVLDTAQNDENQGEEVRERKGSKSTKSVVLSLIQEKSWEEAVFSGGITFWRPFSRFGVSVQAEPTAIWILSTRKLGQESVLLILMLENNVSGRRA